MENQIQYLKRTNKPKPVKKGNGSKRMHLINSFLPQIEASANTMMEIVLIKECICLNIPNHWMENFEMQGGKDKITIKETTSILERIEKWKSKRERDKKPKNSNKKKNNKHFKRNNNDSSKKKNNQNFK